MVVRTDWSSSTISSFCIGWGARVSLHNHGKARTFPGSTGHFNTASMLENDLLYNGQADAGTGLAKRFGALGPVEFLENAFDFLGIHADSLILHGQAQIGSPQLGIDVDLSIGGRILYGVRQQVIESIF